MDSFNLVLPGRVLLSLIFVLSGFGKIFDWSGNAAYMAGEGMPLIPLLLAAAIIAEVGGGLCLLLGGKVDWAALALFVFLIPTTFIFHDFWSYTGSERQTQMINFMKNLAIMGGLLLLARTGPGPFGVEGNR